MGIIEPIREQDGLTQTQFSLLHAYSEFKFMHLALKATGISRAQHNSWMKDSQAYQAKYIEINHDICDELEEEAYRRAVKGTEEFQFYKGKPILHPKTREPYRKLVYSDALLAKLLDANNPDKFKHRVSTEISGPGGGPVSTVSMRQSLLGNQELMDRINEEVERAALGITDTGNVCGDGEQGAMEADAASGEAEPEAG